MSLDYKLKVPGATVLPHGKGERHSFEGVIDDVRACNDGNTTLSSEKEGKLVEIIIRNSQTTDRPFILTVPHQYIDDLHLMSLRDQFIDKYVLASQTVEKEDDGVTLAASIQYLNKADLGKLSEFEFFDYNKII